MKIVCDACNAKYSIADDKVRGKVFKIRCKKCSNVIVVRGVTDAGDDLADSGGASGQARGQKSAFEEGATKVYDSNPGTASTDIWHLVIGEQQVGPMTAEKVEEQIRAGAVNADSYVWREGMDDWTSLGALNEFARVLASASASLSASASASGATSGSNVAVASAAVAGGASIGSTVASTGEAIAGQRVSSASSSLAGGSSPSSSTAAGSSPAGNSSLFGGSSVDVAMPADNDSSGEAAKSPFSSGSSDSSADSLFGGGDAAAPKLHAQRNEIRRYFRSLILRNWPAKSRRDRRPIWGLRRRSKRKKKVRASLIFSRWRRCISRIPDFLSQMVVPTVYRYFLKLCRSRVAFFCRVPVALFLVLVTKRLCTY